MASESAYYRMKKKYFDNKVIFPDLYSLHYRLDTANDLDANFVNFRIALLNELSEVYGHYTVMKMDNTALSMVMLNLIPVSARGYATGCCRKY